MIGRASKALIRTSLDHCLPEQLSWTQRTTGSSKTFTICRRPSNNVKPNEKRAAVARELEKARRVNRSHLRPAEHLRSFMRPTLATTPTAQYVLSPSSRMTELYVCSACIYFTKDAWTCLWSVRMMTWSPALTAERACQELRQW